ncbi:MAG: PBSX family phage terminase large subunit [Bacteroidetes bacterium]|nr:PBSX family phage terminase large subunit [Bacteroidota bacterium]
MIIDFSNPKIFNPIYLPLLNDKNRYILMYGGRDSAKSYFAAQKVIIDTMRKSYSRIILVRKAYAHIKDSQFQTIKDIVSSYGLMDYFAFVENPLRIIFKKNGNMIIARGLDKEHKTKSIKDPTGVWYEEMNEIGFNDFLKTTTSLRGGIIQEIATFNPEMETEWINSYFFPAKESYEKADGNFHFVKSIRDDTTILHTTYKDNTYVTPQSAELLESFKDIDGNYYKIYTLGLWGGVLEGLIYDSWEIIDEMPKQSKLLGYGLDWGFTNDPTAIVRVNMGENTLYLDEILYRKGMTNQELVKEMISAGIDASDEVVADSAEPKSIQELYASGFNVHPALKGPDSVRAGISKIRQYKIKVTARSRNLIRELKNYRWKIDKDGNSLNVPIDNFNHGLDAVRYVVMSKTMIQKKRIFGIRSIKI